MKRIFSKFHRQRKSNRSRRSTSARRTFFVEQLEDRRMMYFGESAVTAFQEKRATVHEKVHTGVNKLADAVLPPTVNHYVDQVQSIAPPPIDPVDFTIGVFTEGPAYLKKKLLEPFLSPVEYTEFTPTIPFTGGTSDPVYYVNGAATRFSGASIEAQALSNQLLRTVRLIHNPTEMATPLFPISENQSATSVAGFLGDMGQAAADRLYLFPGPQHNPTTKMVTQLLYDAYQNGEKISIVGHSQGTLIVNAAMRTIQSLGIGEKSWLRKNVKVVMTGVPMTREEIAKDPNDPGDNLTAYVNEGDIFAESVGYSIGGKYGFFNKILLKGMPALKRAAATHDFVGAYVFQLSNDDLWGEGGRAFGPDMWDEVSLNDTSDDAKDLGDIFPASPQSASLIRLNLHTDDDTNETADEDWFKFEVTDGTLSSDSLIWLSFPNTQSDIDLWVARGKKNAEAGKWITQSTETDTPYEAVNLAGLGKGTYYVRINSDNYVPAEYQLNYQLRPQFTPDKAEPNNNADDATFLGVGAKQGSPLKQDFHQNLHAVGDDDWYYFRLQEAIAPDSKVTLSFEHDAGDIDMNLFREEPNGALTNVANSVSTSNKEEFDLSALDLRPGYYYVRVYGAYGEDVVNSYNFTLDLPAPKSIPPVFTKGASRKAIHVSEGDLVYIDFPAKDLNGDIIDYSLGAGAPAGMDINGHSGKVRYASKIGDGDRYFDITVIATDTKGKSSKSKMRIYVDSAKPTISDVRTETKQITNAGIDPVTLIASGVYFPVVNGTVSFVLDQNNDGRISEGDAFLGNGTFIGSGLYRWDGRIRGNVAPGTYTIFAQASRGTFDGDLKSEPVTTTIDIAAAAPPVQLAFPNDGDQRVSAEGIGDVARGLVTRDDAGNHYVFYTATSNNQVSLLMQKYDASGTSLLTVPLNVSDRGVNDVAMRGNGEFVITNISFEAFHYHVNVRRYDASGNPLSDVLRTEIGDAGSDGTNYHSRVGIDHQGNFVVVWAEGNYTQEKIYYRRYNAANEPLDAKPVPVHPPTNNGQRSPDVAMLPNGDFVVAWLDVVEGRVLGRRFSNIGQGGSVFPISVDSISGFGDSRDIAVEATPTGGILAAWHGELNSESAVLVRQFDANLKPLTENESRVDTYSKSFYDDVWLSVGPSGHAAVSFIVMGLDPNDGDFDTGTYGQLIGPQGEKLGDNFKIPDVDTGNQIASGISVDGDADVFATWVGDLPAGGGGPGGGGPGGPGGGDTKAIFFREFSVNIAPTASSHLEGVTGGSSRTFATTNPDPDGDQLVVTKIGEQSVQPGDAVTLPSGGQVRLETNGNLTFLPTQQMQVGTVDSFEYTVQDGNGGKTVSSAMFVIADPLNVRETQPSLDGGTFVSGLSRLQVEFNQAVKSPINASDIDLRSSGPDGQIGNSDDVPISVTPTATDSHLFLNFNSLAQGVYRLTIRDSVQDQDGSKLDGDADRAAGGNFVRQFRVGEVASQSIASQFGEPVVVGVSPDTMGQLIGGGAGAFDGLNKLQIGSTDYAPIQGLVNVTLPTDQVLMSDGTFHDVGLQTSFVATGGPARIDMQLQSRNDNPSAGRYAFRFVLDGVPLTEYLSDVEAGSTQASHASIHLEEFLEVVSPGRHVLKVEARSVGRMLGGQGLIASENSRLNVWQFAPFENGDPSVVVSSTPLAADVAIPGNAQIEEFLQTTFDSNGGPARLSFPLQLFNATGSNQSISFDVIVDNLRVATTTVGIVGDGRTEGAAVSLIESVLPELAAGSHSVSLQVRSNLPFSDSEVRVAAGSVLSIVQPQSVSGIESNSLVQSFTNSTGEVPVADGSFHPLDLNLPFHFSGDPVRLSLPLELVNQGEQREQVVVRLTIDGDPLNEYVVDVASATGGNEFHHSIQLEDFLNNLAPGDHIAGVELKTVARTDGSTVIATQPATITAQRLTNTPMVTFLDDGSTVLTPSQSMNGVVVNREISVSMVAGAEFVRTLETLVNRSNSSASVSVQLTSDLGSNEHTTVFATSDGDTIVEPTDWWVGTDDDDGHGTPAVIHILSGPYSPPSQTISVSGDTISWNRPVQVPANSTKHTATFTLTANSRTDAISAIDRLVQTSQLSETAVEGMTEDEIQSLANFAFPVIPTQLELANIAIKERVDGGVVGKASIQDPIAGQSYVFAVNDPRFEFVNDELRLRHGSFLRVQNDINITVEVVVTNSATPPQQLTARFALEVAANAKPWQNADQPLDANSDGVVAPIDALMLINLLNDSSSDLLESDGALPEARPLDTLLAFFDVNGDGYTAPNDVLQIINFINGSSGEGELRLVPVTDLPFEDDADFSESVDEFFTQIGVRPTRFQPMVDAGVELQTRESVVPFDVGKDTVGRKRRTIEGGID